MINVSECLSKHGVNIRRLTYLDNFVVVGSDDKKYLLKVKDSNKEELFNYLDQIRYSYFLPLENDYSDCYELYSYYDDGVIDKYIKAKELVYAISLLHLKTTAYVEYNYDKFKRIYEDLDSDIDYTMKYYLDLQDYLEGIEFLSPAQYLLMKNISMFYRVLRIAKERLDEWFNIGNRNVREVLLVGNTGLDNFRVGEKNYFVDFKGVRKDLVIYDLVDFYKREATNIEFSSLFDFYNSKYQLTRDELYLFFAMICIPDKIIFSKSNYQDTLKVRKLVDYVFLTFSFVSEENKEDEKAYEKEFKEQNYNV